MEKAAKVTVKLYNRFADSGRGAVSLVSLGILVYCMLNLQDKFRKFRIYTRPPPCRGSTRRWCRSHTAMRVMLQHRAPYWVRTSCSDLTVS